MNLSLIWSGRNRELWLWMSIWNKKEGNSHFLSPHSWQEFLVFVHSLLVPVFIRPQRSYATTQFQFAIARTLIVCDRIARGQVRQGEFACIWSYVIASPPVIEPASHVSREQCVHLYLFSCVLTDRVVITRWSLITPSTDRLDAFVT